MPSKCIHLCAKTRGNWSLQWKWRHSTNDTVFNEMFFLEILFAVWSQFCTWASSSFFFFSHVILSTGGGGRKCVFCSVEKLDVIDRVPDSSVRSICPHSQWRPAGNGNHTCVFDSPLSTRTAMLRGLIPKLGCCSGWIDALTKVHRKVLWLPLCSCAYGMDLTNVLHILGRTAGWRRQTQSFIHQTSF